MRIGFVGVGRMGRPMLSRLVAAGHQVRALARSGEHLAVIGDAGAEAVHSVDAVCTGAHAVIVCVFSDEQVRQVCVEQGLAAAMPDGSVLVVHTTGSPGTVEEIAARGVDVVDAPVSGGPHDAAAGSLTLFVGGADRAVNAIRPVLRSYGDPILHVGPVGAGQKVKLVNNAVFAAQIGLLAESVALAGRLGLAESALLDALRHGSAASRVLDLVATGGSVRAFVETAGPFIGKDVAVVRRIAADVGGGLGVLDDVIGAAIPSIR